MPMDIRINNVQTDIRVVDPTTLLTPAMRDEIARIVRTVLTERLDEERQRQVDTQLGSRREREGN
jgi:hypothetical protein